MSVPSVQIQSQVRTYGWTQNQIASEHLPVRLHLHGILATPEKCSVQMQDLVQCESSTFWFVVKERTQTEASADRSCLGFLIVLHHADLRVRTWEGSLVFALCTSFTRLMKLMKNCFSIRWAVVISHPWTPFSLPRGRGVWGVDCATSTSGTSV